MCIQRGVLSQGNKEKCYLKGTVTVSALCLRQFNGHPLRRGEEQNRNTKSLACVSVLVWAKWQEGLLGHSRKRSAQAPQSVKELVANE